MPVFGTAGGCGLQSSKTCLQSTALKALVDADCKMSEADGLVLISGVYVDPLH